MRSEILALALIVGAFTWAFRYVPTRLDLSRIVPGGRLSRFLSGTGPAAIATLFVASVLPILTGPSSELLPMTFGTLAVIVVFLARRSVVGATLSGGMVYALVTALSAS